MTWNHRVIRHKHPNGEDYLAIHEVFYTDNIPDGVTEEPIKVIGDTSEELKEQLVWMLKCINHPILDYDAVANTNPSDEGRSDVE